MRQNAKPTRVTLTLMRTWSITTTVEHLRRRAELIKQSHQYLETGGASNERTGGRVHCPLGDEYKRPEECLGPKLTVIHKLHEIASAWRLLLCEAGRLVSGQDLVFLRISEKSPPYSAMTSQPHRVIGSTAISTTQSQGTGDR